MSIVKTEFVKSFDGSSDVSSWLKKVELVARLKNITDEATLIPLYLEGPAFDVYDQMEEKSKRSAEAVKKRLTEAFGQNRFAAYEAFRQRSWSGHESVDAFLSDLRRLAGLAGANSEALITLAFVCGLPADVSSQLRASSRIEDGSLQIILEMARVLMDERVHGAFAVGQSSRQHGGKVRSSAAGCFRCGGDHPARFCKQRKPDITCWRCDQPGHIARHCETRGVSGNANGRQPAPAASQEE